MRTMRNWAFLVFLASSTLAAVQLQAADPYVLWDGCGTGECSCAQNRNDCEFACGLLDGWMEADECWMAPACGSDCYYYCECDVPPR